MKVALSIEVTDQQRNSLAQRIDGRACKRLATRDEVREYVEECLNVLVPIHSAPSDTVESTPLPVSTPSQVSGGADLVDRYPTEALRKWARKLRSEGKPDNWIRGYLGPPNKPNPPKIS